MIIIILLILFAASLISILVLLSTIRNLKTKLEVSHKSEESLRQDVTGLRYNYEDFYQDFLRLKTENAELKEKIQDQDIKYRKVINQKKSSEVRTGLITENLSPFLSDFPFNPEECRFLGNPIDIISFAEDRITFIEIKSGKSDLSKKQRIIRDQIKEGNVDFFLYRVKGD